MRHFLLLFIVYCVVINAHAQPIHDRRYWREIIAQKYQVPAGQEALSLAMELAGFVTSIDPELRDSFGYEILANWIHRSGKLSASDFDALRKAFLPHGLTGISESGTDSVFTRSFALLNLKELAAANLKTPYLTEASFDELFELAVKALSTETDLRGYVAEKGWAHATAHGADLLRILARNSKLSASQQSRLVTVVSSRTQTAATVFAWGEDARLAAALASVANRADADIMAFDTWFAALRAEQKRLWEGEFNTAAYVRVRAQVNVLAQFSSLVAQQSNPAFPLKLREGLHAALAVAN